MSKIILASQSPRRKDLLQREGIDFIIDASSIEENLDPSLPLLERLEDLAKQKGQPIHEIYPEDIVISADTTVYHNGEILGKPKDEADARRMLLGLSDDTHSVFTAVAIFFPDLCVSFVDETKVTFINIEDQLDDYIKTMDWTDKAGGYGIQTYASKFVKGIEGDFDNVVGLPVKRIVDILRKHQD